MNHNKRLLACLMLLLVLVPLGATLALSGHRHSHAPGVDCHACNSLLRAWSALQGTLGLLAVLAAGAVLLGLMRAVYGARDGAVRSVSLVELRVRMND